MNAISSKTAFKLAITALFVAFFAFVVAAPQSAFAAGTWKHNDVGFWYEYNAKGKYYKNCWKEIDGRWYYFKKNGYAQEGWKKSGKYWYYLDGLSDISPAKFAANAKLYDYTTAAKFNDGKIHKIPAMTTGFQYADGDMWYLDPTTGALQTGWIQYNGWKYAKGNGALASGWQKVKKKWYYFGNYDEKTYTAATGWQVISGKSYYFDTKNCAMVTGWKKLSGKWYYFAKTGAMQTNAWIKSGKYWYYVQTDGSMVTRAWIGKYHVDQNGKWDKTRATTTTTTTATNTNTTTTNQTFTY